MLKCVFFPPSQLPVPRRLLPCWASKSIETLSEIIREHSQLCNFIITKGTTASIKTSIQVLKQCTHLKAICLQLAYQWSLKSYWNSIHYLHLTVITGHPVVLSVQSIIYFIPNKAPSWCQTVLSYLHQRLPVLRQSADLIQTPSELFSCWWWSAQ